MSSLLWTILIFPRPSLYDFHVPNTGNVRAGLPELLPPCATVHGSDLGVCYVLYALMLLSMIVTYVMCVICVNALMPLSKVVTYICYIYYMHWCHCPSWWPMLCMLYVLYALKSIQKTLKLTLKTLQNILKSNRPQRWVKSHSTVSRHLKHLNSSQW